MKSEDDILRRLKRRLESTRATVMLEFAFVAPLAVAVAVFAADFTRILRTEQQLEIASRLAADVEAHMADYYGNSASPSSAAKTVAKRYLVDVANVSAKVGDVYIKGSCTIVKNPITYIIDWLNKFMKGQQYKEDNVFLNLIGKVLGGLMNFIRTAAAGRSAWGSSSTISRAAWRLRRGTTSSTRPRGTACTASCRCWTRFRWRR